VFQEQSYLSLRTVKALILDCPVEVFGGAVAEAQIVQKYALYFRACAPRIDRSRQPVRNSFRDSG
jgi:hypothetical protein